MFYAKKCGGSAKIRHVLGIQSHPATPLISVSLASLIFMFGMFIHPFFSTLSPCICDKVNGWNQNKAISYHLTDVLTRVWAPDVFNIYADRMRTNIFFSTIGSL